MKNRLKMEVQKVLNEGNSIVRNIDTRNRLEELVNELGEVIGSLDLEYEIKEFTAYQNSMSNLLFVVNNTIRRNTERANEKERLESLHSFALDFDRYKHDIIFERMNIRQFKQYPLKQYLDYNEINVKDYERALYHLTGVYVDTSVIRLNYLEFIASIINDFSVDTMLMFNSIMLSLEKEELNIKLMKYPNIKDLDKRFTQAKKDYFKVKKEEDHIKELEEYKFTKQLEEEAKLKKAKELVELELANEYDIRLKQKLDTLN